jgi:predicted transcriptional regulator
MERPPVKLEKLEAPQMRRSKLEMCVDILDALAHTGPLKLKEIMYKSNVNGIMLKVYMDFLIKQRLVEERTFNKKSAAFAVTQRGISALRNFRELPQAKTFENLGGIE